MGGIIGAIGTLLSPGGPSAAEKSLAASESTFASELMQDYSTMFNKQQDTLNALKNSYSSVISMGPNQHGYSSPVLNALNTQLINSNAAGYRNSAQAVRNFMAGQGGGATSGLTSGIADQIQGAIAAQASNALTQGQTGIMLSDYNAGQANYWRAVGGMQGLAGLESPTPYGSLASSELSAAFGSAGKISAEQQAAEASKWGAISSLASGAVGMVAGGIDALGSGESLGQGFKDFMSGALGGTGSPAPGSSGSPYGLGPTGLSSQVG